MCSIRGYCSRCLCLCILQQDAGSRAWFQIVIIYHVEEADSLARFSRQALYVSSILLTLPSSCQQSSGAYSRLRSLVGWAISYIA